MSNLKRYGCHPELIKFCNHDIMVESSDGWYVKFDDHKELLNIAHNSRVMPLLEDGCIVTCAHWSEQGGDGFCDTCCRMPSLADHYSPATA